MNIYEKLAELRDHVKQFKKDREGYQYKYVTGDLILTMINPKMKELGLVFTPNLSKETIRYDRFQYESKTEKTDKKTKETIVETKTKVDYIVSGEMEYRLVNTEDPNECITYNWALFGLQDDVSKAYGSALTYAERYLLLKILSVPTDEIDPDFLGQKKPELSNEQIYELYLNAGKCGFSMKDVELLLTARYRISSVMQLQEVSYHALMTAMASRPQDLHGFLASARERWQAAGIGVDE